MLSYTFHAFVPGFAASSVLNDTPSAEVVQKPIDNANDEGALLFGVGYKVGRSATPSSRRRSPGCGRAATGPTARTRSGLS